MIYPFSRKQLQETFQTDIFSKEGFPSRSGSTSCKEGGINSGTIHHVVTSKLWMPLFLPSELSCNFFISLVHCDTFSAGFGSPLNSRRCDRCDYTLA